MDKKKYNLKDKIQSWGSVLGSVLLGKQTREDKKPKRALLETIPKQDAEEVTIDMTLGRVARITIVILLLLTLFTFIQDISGILLIFFISFLLAAALDPLVDKLQDLKIPRSLSMILIYIVLFFLVGIFISNVVSLVYVQVSGIAFSVGEWVADLNKNGAMSIPISSSLQPYIDQFFQTVDVQSAASQLQHAFDFIRDQLLNISIGLFNLIIVLTLTFFMTVEEASIDNFFLSIFPSRHAKYISQKMEDVKDQVGLWLRGQLFVSIVAGVLSYIGLAIMGVDYALTLSLIAGISMVIPVVGRFIAWLITFPIVFNQSPALSAWMSIYYLAIQQVENNILVPKIMNKAVGLSPIIIIFAMMVGYRYLDIIGLVFSIPIATTVAIFVKDYTQRDK